MRAKVGLLFIALACARKPQPPVILITIDTLRADHLPAYGYRDVATPAIDSLRRDGVLFSSAWSHCPMTLPSHVSILTGQLPTEHGVRNNVGFSVQPDRHPTISQALHAGGYATGAMVSAFVLRGRTGLAQAFDTYDDVDQASRSATALDLERPASVTAQHAIQWIRERGNGPFFLFVHFFEPHAPYEPPEPFRSRFANPYDGEIATADAAVGQIIDELKRRQIYTEAMIILTADHGEGLGDHGEKQHSVLLYTETIRVPLIVKLPGNDRAGTTIATPVQHADIATTIAAVTRVPFKGGQTSRSLFEAQGSRSIYSETLYPRIHLGWSDLASLFDGADHYIESPRPELYDLRHDPRETTDVIATRRRDAARLRSALQQFRTAIPESGPIDPDVAASLAALGYVGSPGAANRNRAALVNPRDHIGEYERVRDDLADGIAIDAALQRNDVSAAAVPAERIAARRDASAAALLLAGKAFLRGNDPARALALLDRAENAARLSGRPRVPELQLTRADALARMERFGDAVTAYQQEIAAFPDNLRAYATLAALYYAMNEPTRGDDVLTAMVKANPTRAAESLAAQTAAAVENMTSARRWRGIAATLR
ncbi:MAG: sulfatase-like hydrolase/transferase [Thermoanaerobaculia bacterium]